jgi:hypothetical protein
MTMQILAINVEVECSDGTTHQGVRLAVDGTRRVYLAADDTEISDVQTVTKCLTIVPPMVLAAALQRCKECEQ